MNLYHNSRLAFDIYFSSIINNRTVISFFSTLQFFFAFCDYWNFDIIFF
jgi:hypothetical protein